MDFVGKWALEKLPSFKLCFSNSHTTEGQYHRLQMWLCTNNNQPFLLGQSKKILCSEGILMKKSITGRWHQVR